ncbi:MAG: bifunctional pyr operon transcriptional regulator/uracil phosphoribosyltransferase PyrR [Burkholderiaceae bacterium]
MTTQLPDAEAAYQKLLTQVKECVASQPVLLVGIHTGGAWVASRLAADLRQGDASIVDNNTSAAEPDDPHPENLELGFLSSAFHRDDLASRGLPATMKATHLPLSIDGRDILLIDDILYTGRTIRAALNELFDYGRPRTVQLAILLDRGGRHLPVQPDHCGGTVSLATDDNVQLAQSPAGEFSFELNPSDANPS